MAALLTLLIPCLTQFVGIKLYDEKKYIQYSFKALGKTGLEDEIHGPLASQVVEEARLFYRDARYIKG